RELGEREAALRSLNAKLDAANAELKQRAADLEAANKELEAFSYSVSHDLRAPLRHIDAYIEMLQEATEGKLDATSKRYLDVIVSSSTRMGRLIDELLEFSKMGRTAMREQAVELDSIVREAVETLRAANAQRAIEWKIARLPRVIGDAGMLRQVFVNLLDNATKYTAKRERALIEIGLATEEEGGIVVYVRDNGVGF